MNKIITGFFVTIIILGGLYLFFNNNSSKTTSEKTTLQNQKQEKQKDISHKINLKSPITDDYLKEMLKNPLTRSTDLKDVTGKDSTGTAYILRVDNSLTHYIQATLPEPKKGNEYEGWLVKKTPKLQFFSTGTMKKDVNGKYILHYGVDDFDNITDGYDFVVVTEESVIDENPEIHILEGSF